MSKKSYLNKKIVDAGIAELLAIYLTIFSSCYFFAKEIAEYHSTSVFLWASSFALGTLVFFGTLNYCFLAQKIRDDEIERITVVKSRLENQILQKRQSSKKTKRVKS